MKKTIFLLIMIFASSIQAQNQEIQKVIETFFEGFHAKDTIKMKSVCSDKIILQSIMENANSAKLLDESAKEFYKSIASIPATIKIKEKILGYSIQVDGTMAHAWTPYEFYLNDKFSHSGVNAFTLFKENGTWKIIYVIDTRRK
ncbi:nuclear transport factor 2 family protein [Flavobacterium sp.]|uniref:nuclear transport factor 2 family protein n=1 Tax=Flavobacterium sp. TaxID=239 RepID=UPI0026221D4D|nr:nuclear transport factor 2 family protein [Flavobacterium sp.]